MATAARILTIPLLLALGSRTSRPGPPPKPVLLARALSALRNPTHHTGRPTPSPRMTTDVRYPPVPPPPNTANLHGEIEVLEDGTEATHWYAESSGVTWHFVTAGDPSNHPILVMHGLPESWWSWHHQISEFAKDHYVIAMDNKGYGQSDKRLDLDYTNATMAKEMGVLLDQLGVDRFTVIAHDRGVIIADHMCAVPELEGRFARYIRMQQSFNEPHGEPRPPHKMFASKIGTGFFLNDAATTAIYTKIMPSNLSPETLERLDYEFKFKGVAPAVSKYFETTNFDIEHNDRHGGLFDKMTMPMLILQGRLDRGQHPEEYDNSPSFVSDCRVEFVDASHFCHIENPTDVNAAIRTFLTERPV